MSIVIKKDTIHRLVRDVKDIIVSPLENEKIYYKHSDDDILIGHALIIGPKDTPFQYGNYFFRFEFPNDYPYSPPTVIYLSNDGFTRFHPNLYTNGKVCLSILNTWKGEQWDACQTIRSILITIWSILDNNPLLHEPGVKIDNKDVIQYKNIINYKNIDTTINGILLNKYCKNEFNLFKEEVISNFKENYEDIIKAINNLRDKKQYRTCYYGLFININKNYILETTNLINKQLNN